MREYFLTVEPGQSVEFAAPNSNVIFCDQANLSEFALQIDNDDRIRFFEGRKYTAPVNFSRISVINTLDQVLTLNLLVGLANIEDSVTTLSGNIGVFNADAPNDELNIKTKDGTTLRVDNGQGNLTLSTMSNQLLGLNNDLNAMNTSVSSAVNGIENILNSDRDQHAPLSTFSNTTYAYVRNASLSVAFGSTNPNGIIVRHLFIEKRGAGICEVRIGSNVIIELLAAGRVLKENFFIPAGSGFHLETNTTACQIMCAYQIL